MSGNTSATGGFIQPTSTPPLDHEGLADLLQTMIVGMTGLPMSLVRPRWQPQPPTQPPVTTDWCAVGVDSYIAYDYPFVLHESDTSAPNGEDNLYRLERINILTTFYGPNASSNAGYVRDGIYINQNYNMLSQAGLKLRGADDIIYAPELINSQYVARADLPISFMRLILRTYPVLDILSAVVTLYANNGDSCTETIDSDDED